jgi:hypothetical protein
LLPSLRYLRFRVRRSADPKGTTHRHARARSDNRGASADAVTGFDGAFETSEPQTEIVTLLWDPDPNARLWPTVEQWLANGDLLTVAFSYECLSLGDARPLWRFLAGETEYLVKVVESDVAGYWAVEGRMETPIYLTLKFLNDWV